MSYLLTLAMLASACKWPEFLGHNDPIEKRANLLITKVYVSERLFHSTVVVLSILIAKVAANREHSSILPRKCYLYINNIFISYLPIALSRWESGAISSNRLHDSASWRRQFGSYDDGCTFLHRLQVRCLPDYPFSATFLV